jgi:hypothetical protein
MFRKCHTLMDNWIYLNSIITVKIIIRKQHIHILCYCCRGLCDVNNTGRLNGEQFCLAMYLIHQKVGFPILEWFRSLPPANTQNIFTKFNSYCLQVKGIEPPQTLPPEMIPPSMRVPGQALVVPASSAIDDANKVRVNYYSHFKAVQ